MLKKLTSHRTRYLPFPLASHHYRKRIPVLSYLHTNGVPILRSSQPRRGVTNTVSRDATYLDVFSAMSPDKRTLNCDKLSDTCTGLYVYDSRSFAAAQANRTLGGGFEDYKNTKILFCDIENIHAVRGSWQMLVKLCGKGNRNDPTFLTRFTETGTSFFENYPIFHPPL